MKWSLKIAKIAGIKLYIHWTFILLITWVFVANLREGINIEQALYSVGLILAVFLCIVLHELGHALIAKRYKHITKEIVLLPIGGMARMDELPESPKEEFLISLAGPLVNFLIAMVLWPIIYYTGGVPTFTSLLFYPQRLFLFDIFVVNLALGIFNLIPAFPMDGGRVFRALLSMRLSRVRATEVAAHTGQLISIFFLFIGLFHDPILVFIAVFIFLMAQSETEYVRSRSILHDYTVKDIIMHKFYKLDSSAPIMDAVKLLMDVQASDFLVTEHDNIVGTLSSQDIIKTLSSKGTNALVLDAMKTNVSYLTPEVPVNKAYMEFQNNRKTIIPVMENGQVIGIVDLNHILELIMIKEASQRSFVQ